MTGRYWGGRKSFFAKKKKKTVGEPWGGGRISEKNVICAEQRANANEVKMKPVDWRAQIGAWLERSHDGTTARLTVHLMGSPPEWGPQEGRSCHLGCRKLPVGSWGCSSVDRAY